MMSQRSSRLFNRDNVKNVKFADYENADSAQENLLVQSYFDAHVDSPSSRAPRTLVALSSITNTTRLKSPKKVDHFSRGKEGLGTQPHKCACTASVFRFDHAKASLRNASASCVRIPNYVFHTLKQARPMQRTIDQTCWLPSSSAGRSTYAARPYCSNPPSRSEMSSLLDKFSSLRVCAGDNAKQASKAIKVSQVESVKQAENAKERSLTNAEPQKPGLPLRAKIIKAVSRSPAMTKLACLFTSTKTAGQLITAKPVNQASKASQAEDSERRSQRYAEPRKLDQQLRAQNACTFTVVSKQIALSNWRTAVAPRTRPATSVGPCRYVERAAMNVSKPKNNDWNKKHGSATELNKGVHSKERKKQGSPMV
ncbi:hypothetical protein HPB51_021598 [Rhipicephalus microplus]|uniref:Uncharacterized protein n=1 Tax=Rhipicephalus microplus TaxID=6941 RepID=A0A9J6EIE7_RHIMP|nr:hypothetical protein HPB51_021598 [Rhipicephalus microplus]